MIMGTQDRKADTYYNLEIDGSSTRSDVKHVVQDNGFTIDNNLTVNKTWFK